MEFGAPVWNFGITKREVRKLERCQKIGLAIIEGKNYTNYKNSLRKFSILPLEKRRQILTARFADKAMKHGQFGKWFKRNNETKIKNTRSKQITFKTVPYKKMPYSDAK